MGEVTGEVRLDVDAVLAAARKASGLADLHEQEALGRLDVLTRHFDRDLGLDRSGRAAALEILSDLVAQRARLLTDRSRYPDIRDERIERPIFVAGFGRSGTTLLHMLLAADPGNRAPEWWETRFPSPPPGISAPDDPRHELADREMAEILEVVPGLRQAHPYFDAGGAAAVEDEGIWALDLRAIRRTIYFRVPAQITVRLEADPLGAYEFHRKVLQALQWKTPRRRWVLKGLTHHENLPALKAVYPDAIVIWLHRDPQRTFPSWAELTFLHDEGMARRPLDRRVFGRTFLETFSRTLDAAVASPLSSDPDVVHLQYAELRADPIGTLRSIYGRFDLPFDEAVEAAMRGWLDDPANRSDRHGKFLYPLEPFGVTPDELEARAAGYRARFGVPREASGG